MTPAPTVALPAVHRHALDSLHHAARAGGERRRARARRAALLAALICAAPTRDVGAQAGAQVGTAAAPVIPQARAIDSLLRAEMTKRRIPGLQAAVVRGGRIVFSAAYGVADLETGAPVTPTTTFTLNSSTKSFTGVAVMQLVQDGRLALDAPIARYVDDLPPAWRPVTVAQLLTHVSGLPDVVVQPRGQGTGTLVGEGGEASAWTAVRALPMEAEPGTGFRYNQTNYVLLGRAIERVTGMPFTRFMQERQFDVVGMPHTAFGDARTILPGRVRTYRYASAPGAAPGAPPALEHAFDEFSPFLRTAAGLNATAEEVARWLVALQGGTLLDRTTLTAMWTPARLADGRPTSWAMGWPLNARAAHPVVAGIGGRRSAFFVYPQDDLAVVVLTNLAGAAPESFLDEIAGQFHPELLARNGGGLPPAVQRLRAALLARGFDRAVAVHAELARRDSTFRVSEGALNDWGGRLLQDGETARAVAVFQLNATLFPASANTHDSLAEAFEVAGAPARAIASYRRSLELDASNTHARERLAALQAPPAAGPR